MLSPDKKEEDMQEKPKLKRSTGLCTGSGKDIIAKGFVLLLAGIPVYVLVKWRVGRRAEREIAEGFELPPPVVDEGVHYAHGDELEPAGRAR
jgi:hypothetical protein